MTALELRVGSTYYELTFADPGLTMPGVRPLVFLGQTDGVTPEGLPCERHFVFQDTVSYVRYGSRIAPGAVDHEDQQIFFMPAEDIGSSLHELAGIVEQLQEALHRSVELGEPQLSVSRGNWRSAT